MTSYIVSIRPQPDADLDVAALARRNVPALACPVMAPDYDLIPLNRNAGEFAGVIFTSRHAVTGFINGATGSGWQDLPAYCVGRATARSAAKAGFTRIVTGHGGGRGLAPLIRRDASAMCSPLFWPSATQISFNMTTELASDIAPVGGLSPSLIEDLQNRRVGGVIMMSARSAMLFTAALEKAGLEAARPHITVIAGSKAIADAAEGGWQDCLVARRATRARLLAIASLLYHRRLT